MVPIPIRRGSAARTLVLVVTTVGLGMGSGSAEPPFDGVALTPLSGRYLVIAESALRGRPLAQASPSGRVKVGDKLEAVGSAAGGWLAVRKSGGEAGFLPAAAAAPLIDGALAKDLELRAAAPGGVSCSVLVHYLGRSPVVNAPLETSDYALDWRCQRDRRRLEFTAFMFITEAPFALTAVPVYQIGLDVRDIGDGVEDTLSTTVLYEAHKGRVVLDAVSPKEYFGSPAAKERPARGVEEALAGAVVMAVQAWNDKVWRKLADRER